MTAAITRPHHPRRHAGGTPWAAARALAHRVAEPLDLVEVPLTGSAGRTLARPLVAAVDLPGFDNAAMDGYAVRGDGPWRVVGGVLAGGPGAAPLAPGEAVEIATGAPVPRGADRVVPYEVVARHGAVVSASGDGAGKRHIRRAGEYVTAGRPVLPAGSVLTAAALGLAASVGVDVVTVRRAPTVRLLLTGDEIVTAGTPAPGQVRDAIGPTLTALLRAWSADLVDVRWTPDHPAAVTAAAVERSLGDVDVTVVAGASSVGPADALHDVLTTAGATLHVDGVDCRPGHPQVLASRAGHWLVGLPGNPFAAMVAAFTLLQPLLAGLAGRPLPALPRVCLDGAARVHATATSIVPVRWDGAAPSVVDGARPGHLGAAALADALAVVPPGWCPGEPVELLVLPQ
ncbi:molybdopterin molybdotransferase MoeA [Dactylosporangium sp. NPDC049742]|uniref:molybdopterin molybdotransferase MoeA n=1 Tax=Dactylosporangium sp. NPDC049742 TaxID=3154737 RepID=UPI003443E4C3